MEIRKAREARDRPVSMRDNPLQDERTVRSTMSPAQFLTAIIAKMQMPCATQMFRGAKQSSLRYSANPEDSADSNDFPSIVLLHQSHCRVNADNVADVEDRNSR